MIPDTLIQIAALILPLVPLGLFAWVIHGYRNGTIRQGFRQRLPRAMIVIVGVALPVWAHWNYDWYATYSATDRHLYLLSLLAIVLVIGLSFLLRPIWIANRRKLLLAQAVALATFALIWLGVMDPARLAQFYPAFFSLFATTLVVLGEAIMIWQIATADSSADDSMPYGNKQTEFAVNAVSASRE